MADMQKRKRALFECSGDVCERLGERTRPWPRVHVFWLTGPQAGDKEWIPKETFSRNFTKLHPKQDPQNFTELMKAGQERKRAGPVIYPEKGGESKKTEHLGIVLANGSTIFITRPAAGADMQSTNPQPLHDGGPKP